MKTLKCISIFTLVVMMLSVVTNSLYANDINVSNVSLVGQNIVNGVNGTNIKFDISWENSWRTSSAPNNWDAAWVFVKYRVGSGAWQHATLNTTADNHTAPPGSTSTIDPTDDGKGVFIYRSADGEGIFTLTGVQLRWEHHSDGVTDNAQVEVAVHAIEMVYVPQGAFFVGDGYRPGTDGSYENGGFTDGSWTSGATIPFNITSENALGIDNAAGKLWGISSGHGWGHDIGPAGAAEVTLPAAFPKGFGAFYSMKYEISQGQYRDFLNTLTYTQQATRTINAPNSAAGTAAMSNNSRNGLVIKTPGVSTTTPAVYASNLDGDGIYDEPNDGENIPMNHIDCRDLMAILDWAGLRPMTELEFEKAARGPMTPVRNEFAWGTASVTPATGISNSGETNEIASNAGANASFNSGVSGPMRVGTFAGSATTRVQSGASYYGIMELTGSQQEHIITVAMAEGRVFSGLHGDGALDATGNRDVTDWPETAIDGKYTGLYIGLGFGIRGGSYGTGSSDVQFGKISSRGAARNSNSHSEWTRSNRGGDKGGRGVRGLPVSTTNGTAVVSAYNCNTASAGTMESSTAVSGVTQTITATVTTVGTYNIIAYANGVTFAAIGTFAGTGDQAIVLTATGTPTAAGTNSFTINTTPNCNFLRTTTGPVEATGGTVTNITDGGIDYRVHTFTSSGNFVVTAGGDVEYLIVGGGGGAGTNGGGGGGAGGVLTGSFSPISTGTFPVTIGAGGEGATYSPTLDRGDNGQNSVFNGLTAIGGGGGASRDVNPPAGNPGSGGSGGGGGGSYTGGNTTIGASGTVGQGSRGGDGFDAGANAAGGGGGGYGSAGTNGSYQLGGNGGNGYFSSISGTNTGYAGGGCGGGVSGFGHTSGTVQAGAGGGGPQNGSRNGRANSGGGGGQYPHNASGGNGGSGIVIIRYKI